MAFAAFVRQIFSSSSCLDPYLLSSPLGSNLWLKMQSATYSFARGAACIIYRALSRNMHYEYVFTYFSLPKARNPVNEYNIRLRKRVRVREAKYVSGYWRWKSDHQRLFVRRSLLSIYLVNAMRCRFFCIRIPMVYSLKLISDHGNISYLYSLLLDLSLRTGFICDTWHSIFLRCCLLQYIGMTRNTVARLWRSPLHRSGA